MQLVLAIVHSDDAAGLIDSLTKRLAEEVGRSGHGSKNVRLAMAAWSIQGRRFVLTNKSDNRTCGRIAPPAAE